MHKRLKYPLLSLFLFSFSFPSLNPWSEQKDATPYSVEIEGKLDHATLDAVKQASRLFSLKKKPPSSINALKFRGRDDLEPIRKALTSYGYYEASVQTEVIENKKKAHVIIHIETGPLYTLSSYDIEPKNIRLKLSDLNIDLGKVARFETIINAELLLLEKLAEKGYPLASIKDRKIIVDGKTKSVRVFLDVESGAKSYFGALTVQGNTKVKQVFFDKKVKWKEGDPYDGKSVDLLQKKLLDSGLFSSVLISHAEPQKGSYLPMKIEVTESKQRSINIGLSYQTFFREGITFGWENRNIGGMGRKLTIQGEKTRKSHSGIARLLTRDFIRAGQDYTIQLKADHESITAYSRRSYSFLNRFEKESGSYLKFSLGINAEWMEASNDAAVFSAEENKYLKSRETHTFRLLEGQLYGRIGTAKNTLNPTRGIALEYRATPTMRLDGIKKHYCTQNLGLSLYKSFDDFLVVAQKVGVASILSRHLEDIPISKRIFGGSDENLRGFKYLTVSKLNEIGMPIGGRSAFFYTLELRLKFGESFGVVPFFDLGKVCQGVVPQFSGHFEKAAGCGLRYFSFMGPLRFDIGFPLHRRKGLDERYRVFVSVGQMF